jgi:2-hydroxy-3-keto-5-methylthiopentenyl-1-phosphate phosphatase
MAKLRGVFVTDFDGTISGTEFYQLVGDVPNLWGAFAAGRITHVAAMARYCAAAGTDLAHVEKLAASLNPDPRFGELVAALAAVGWQTVIASAGCEWYIRRALAPFGVEVPVVSNRGRWEPGRGLVLEAPADSPFFDAEVGISKAAVVRDALTRADRVAFAGDGTTDLPAAVLVPPELRFAKWDLAAGLTRRGERFRRFDRWADAADAVLAAAMHPGE